MRFLKTFTLFLGFLPSFAFATYLGDPVNVKSGGTGLSALPAAGQILIGNAGGTAYALALLSGDATMASTGALTIANLAITNAKIANSTIDLTAKVTGILPNANTTAASANTASAIVARDGSGNFIAGTITAALTGTASGNLQATATNHGVLISGAGNTASVTAVGATNTVLHGNTGADPTYSAIVNADITNATINLTTKVTGILPVANATIANQALTTCSTARTIDWSTGNNFTVTLTNGSTCAFTFSNAVSGQTINLDIYQPSSGGGTANASWATTTFWAGGTAPTITTGNSKTDTCTLKYNGTDYRGSCVQDLR